MKITLIAGARPNFIKIAPIIRAFESNLDIEYRLVHTGQHYDEKLSGSFFSELDIPNPDVNLGVGAGSHSQQTAAIMLAFEQDLKCFPCDYILVVGDVNSTLACSLVAKKSSTKVIHVEAGLRSYDLEMPEEINRMVVDAIADVFFTTTIEASKTLVSEGKDVEKIHFVGNVMIDSLIAASTEFKEPTILNSVNLDDKVYFVLTLHRPSNVDDIMGLQRLMKKISESVREKHVVIFPVHPRTKKNLRTLAMPDNIYAIDPLSYLEFMYLVTNAIGVITDSGGVQEETTYLGVPCLTLRDNTERPETIDIGTNELIGDDEEALQTSINKIIDNKWKKGEIPDLWDGAVAQRISEIITNLEK